MASKTPTVETPVVGRVTGIIDVDLHRKLEEMSGAAAERSGMKRILTALVGFAAVVVALWVGAFGLYHYDIVDKPPPFWPSQEEWLVIDAKRAAAERERAAVLAARLEMERNREISVNVVVDEPRKPWSDTRVVFAQATPQQQTVNAIPAGYESDPAVVRAQAEQAIQDGHCTAEAIAWAWDRIPQSAVAVRMESDCSFSFVTPN